MIDFNKKTQHYIYYYAKYHTCKIKRDSHLFFPIFLRAYIIVEKFLQLFSLNIFKNFQIHLFCNFGFITDTNDKKSSLKYYYNYAHNTYITLKCIMEVFHLFKELMFALAVAFWRYEKVRAQHKLNVIYYIYITYEEGVTLYSNHPNLRNL